VRYRRVINGLNKKALLQRINADIENIDVARGDERPVIDRVSGGDRLAGRQPRS
jgi:hypothetical protein